MKVRECEKRRDKCENRKTKVSLEQFEELRLRLVAYEAQQELGQAKMKAEVKEQVSEVTDGLKELYNTASVAVGTVASRVDKLEEKIRGGAMQGQKSLLHHYNMSVAGLEVHLLQD